MRDDRRFTVKDYRSWAESERWELIDGVAYAMAPAPSSHHQELVGELFYSLRGYLEGKPCKVFVSPIDLYFTDDDDASTAVQPDLAIVCDKRKIRQKWNRGRARPDYRGYVPVFGHARPVRKDVAVPA